MINKNYEFAGITFAVESEVSITDVPSFTSFYSEKNENADFHISVKQGKLPERAGNIIYDNNISTLYDKEGEKLLYSAYPSGKIGSYTDYACLKKNGRELHLTVTGEMRDNIFFRAVNIPALLLEKGTALFHSSFITVNDKAILFTGKSGAGKTTQAQLWERCRGALLINGDRSALKLVNGELYALPVPFRGSSAVALNKKAKIGALISLEKSASNTICALNASEAFQSVLSGITYEPKNMEESRTAVELALRVASAGLVFKLQCRKDDEMSVCAVESILKD